MAAEKVQCDPDGMRDVTQTFKQEADRVKTIISNLKSKFEPLDGGQQWLGKGAAEFKREMNQSVLKELNNLQKALDEASKTTKDIQKEFDDTDSDVEKLWKVFQFGFSLGRLLT